MQEKNGISDWWNILLSIGGVFGLLNLVRAFRSAPKEAHEEYEEIIIQKDKIIAQLEKKVEQYQRLLEHDK